MLLTQDELLDRLQELLDISDSLDIAVAWASPSDALSRITAFARARAHSLRSIVGISGNATHPAALRDLGNHGLLRVPRSNPLFHPKLFLFYGQGGVIVWIGSANLSRCGFQQNTELMFEFADDGTAAEWFKQLWNSLDDDPSSIIEEYERAWKPAGPAPRTPVATEQVPGEDVFRRAASQLSDWASYVEALGAASLYWMEHIGISVDGETTSWLNTITLGNAVMRRDSWRQLTRDDYRLIMGIETKVDVGYGLLGSMKAAGNAKNVFNAASKATLAIRERIRSALQPVLGASPASFPDATVTFIRDVTRIKGFSDGVATRLLALARPDLAVSVNKGSRDGLAALSGLPATSLAKAPGGSRAHSYADLLEFLGTQPWYSRPTPRNAYERTLATARAALLDCLVYQLP